MSHPSVHSTLGDAGVSAVRFKGAPKQVDGVITLFKTGRQFQSAQPAHEAVIQFLGVDPAISDWVVLACVCREESAVSGCLTL